jgi:hypothetical protein
MESREKEIITLIFAFAIIILGEKNNLGIIGEGLILIYFLGLFIWVFLVNKKDSIYNYLSVIFFILLIFFSLLGAQSVAEQVAVFIFYSLASKLLYVLLHYLIRNEKK